ncbi:MAG: phage protein Gp36 family protein [Candidatus Anammoxibacter sp.]
MGTQYATETNITNNLKAFDPTASGAAVDSTKLATYIEEESQVIDMHIQSRYALPVTDDDAKIFLRKICIDLVVYRVAKVLMPREQIQLPNGTTIQDISQIGAWRNAMKMLKDLMDGTTTLPSTTEDSKVFASSYQDTNDTKKNFELDVKQW